MMSTASSTSLEAAPSSRVTTEHTKKHRIVIAPRASWQLINRRELVAYRDLLGFLVWRQIRVRYAQSAIGIGWAVIQPVFSMLLFTVVFGHLAKVSSDGAPYAIFSFVALVPWTYFSNALSAGGNSLVSEASIMSKVYFPRLFLPFSAILSKLVDLGIAMVCLALLLVYYQQVPTLNVVFLPVLILLMVIAAIGFSLWLTALAVQYRDINHAIGFMVQLGMYATPVVYPTSLIPEEYRLLYAINPMVGVIDGFRAALLNTHPMPWDLIAIGACTATVALLTGLVFFNRKETIFADVA